MGESKNTKMWLPVVIAVILTVIIRLTVFGADCNLLVVGITFVLILTLCYGIQLLCRRIMRL